MYFDVCTFYLTFLNGANLGICPTENGIYLLTTQTRIFIAALFVISPRWKQFKWLSAVEWINTSWSIQMQCGHEGERKTYNHTQQNRWISNITQRERSQTRKNQTMGLTLYQLQEEAEQFRGLLIRRPGGYPREGVGSNGWGDTKVTSRTLVAFLDGMLITQVGSVYANL